MKTLLSLILAVLLAVPLAAQAITINGTLWASGPNGVVNPVINTIELAFTSAQTDTKIVTVSGGTTIVLLGALLDCDNANTVNVAARIGLAQTNTPTTTKVYTSHPGVAAGSGVNVLDGNTPIIGADGDDILITAGVPTTGSCRAVVKYYTMPS